MRCFYKKNLSSFDGAGLLGFLKTAENRRRFSWYFFINSLIKMTRNESIDFVKDIIIVEVGNFRTLFIGIGRSSGCFS